MLVSHVGRYDRLPQRVVTDLDCHSLGNRTALPIGNGNGQMIGQFLLRITIQQDMAGGRGAAAAAGNRQLFFLRGVFQPLFRIRIVALDMGVILL